MQWPRRFGATVVYVCLGRLRRRLSLYVNKAHLCERSAGREPTKAVTREPRHSSGRYGPPDGLRETGEDPPFYRRQVMVTTSKNTPEHSAGRVNLAYLSTVLVWRWSKDMRRLYEYSKVSQPDVGTCRFDEKGADRRAQKP